MKTEVNMDLEKQEQFWAAAKTGDCATIRMLAMSGQVDVNAKNEDGFDAFNLATQAGKAEAATAILAAREVQYMRELGLIPDGATMPADEEDGQKTA